jgi:hypothetical protein
VSVLAGQEIRKLPLSQISQSMTGYPPIAVTAGSNLHRPLRPIIRTVAAPSLNSRSGRFAIKLPTFSDVRNAHKAAECRGLGERYALAVPRPFEFNFLAV